MQINAILVLNILIRYQSNINIINSKCNEKTMLEACAYRYFISKRKIYESKNIFLLINNRDNESLTKIRNKQKCLYPAQKHIYVKILSLYVAKYWND